MRSEKLPSSLLCVLALTGCAHVRQDRKDVDTLRAEATREVAILVARGGPENLATAALLAAPYEPKAPQPLALIEQAEALAPQRPELVWIHLAICQRLKCDSIGQIEARLQTLDPDNGLVWWRMNADMRVRIDAARQTDSEEEVELATLKSFGLPTDPPMKWQDSWHSG